VYGFTSPGASVTTTFNGTALVATAEPDGTWRQRLPQVSASTAAFLLNISSSSGETASLEDVLFGEVFMCGGQSNMEYAVPATTNSTAEAALADAYPDIRFFSVGHATQSATPLQDLQTVWEPWQVASASSIRKDFYPGHTMFSTFSSVCWFFGRTIADGLAEANGGARVPVGLISNNWGGTKLEVWAPAEAFAQCQRNESSGNMYNAMILPYAVGPMALAGFAFYQGEANTESQASAANYSCLFPAVIEAWRALFDAPDAYFGFIQLSTWCTDLDPASIPSMRDAQMSGAALHKVGWATNADAGFGCNIHPPAKQYCGTRLGRSALAVQYGHALQWRSPSYLAARRTAPLLGATGLASVSLQVELADVTLRRSQ